jgi:hypothetical protein
MSLVTLKPGRRVTLAPYLDAIVVEVARDGVKLELITTGPQLPLVDLGHVDPSAEPAVDETADAESSRFFAEFA